jgi:bifunctional DNA-binding transcriptional regulator/antitoxin component of YhaV-PrlF toxin-antitoxin module
MGEEIVGVVRCFDSNRQGHLVVSIPSYARKVLEITPGTRLLVKIIDKKSLVYEKATSQNCNQRVE